MPATRQLPPARVLVALGVTVLAVVVLGAQALLRGGGDDDGGATPEDQAGATSSSTTASERVVSTTTSSIAVLPDWYPKQSSRYSDRGPVVTLTTLAPTTTAEPDDEIDGAGSSVGSG